MIKIYVKKKDVGLVTGILEGTIIVSSDFRHDTQARRAAQERLRGRVKPKPSKGDVWHADISLGHVRSWTEFKPYKGGIWFADVPEGSIAKLRKLVAVGRVGIWKGKETKVRRHMVRIRGHAGHPNGIILTPYSAKEVKAGGGKLITERMPGVKRVEMKRSGDVVVNALDAYGRKVRRGSAAFKPLLVLYHPPRRRPR